MEEEAEQPVEVAETGIILDKEVHDLIIIIIIIIIYLLFHTG